MIYLIPKTTQNTNMNMLYKEILPKILPPIALKLIKNINIEKHFSIFNTTHIIVNKIAEIIKKNFSHDDTNVPIKLKEIRTHNKPCVKNSL